MDLDTSDEFLNEFLRSFEEYEDENIIIHENATEAKIVYPVAEITERILLGRAKYNLSYAAVASQSKTINLLPCSDKVPTDKNAMKREVNLKYNYEIHVFCDYCKFLFKEGNVCEDSGKSTKKRKNNHFVFISISQQIQNTLNKHSEEILLYIQ